MFCSGNKVYWRAQIQYAPTLTYHDPNPPITLEHVFEQEDEEEEVGGTRYRGRRGRRHC